MHNDSIAELTRQLEALRIERERINEEERSIIQALREASPPNSDRTNGPGSNSNSQHDRFVTGDRVLINNKINHTPSNRQVTIKDRAATVRRATSDKVYLTTYNGTKTWRFVGNVTGISEEEYQQAVTGS